jgi:hypothetical protein
MDVENPPTQSAADPWESLSASESELDDETVVSITDDPDPDSTLEANEPCIFGNPVIDEAEAEAADANEAAVTAAIAEIEQIEQTPVPTHGGMFTIPMLCAGIAIIAACLLIPQADAYRRLVYERTKLQADLEAVEKQVAVNDEFLRKVADDANLAERLAQRQMKIIREGNQVLNLKNEPGEEMSPFQLTAVPAAAELEPYEPRGGIMANLCYNPRSRLYLMGAGLLAMAGGLVLGIAPRD